MKSEGLAEFKQMGDACYIQELPNLFVHFRYEEYTLTFRAFSGPIGMVKELDFRTDNLVAIFRFLFVISLIIPVWSLKAQFIPIRPVTLLDHNLGLLESSNFFMYKDSRDLVWITSNSGLFCFNGKNLRKYYPEPENSVTLNPNSIHSFLVEDDRGNLWFGAWSGIFKYDRAQDTFSRFEMPGTSPSARFFVSGFDQEGQLWFTHGNGMYTLNTSTHQFTRRSDFNASLWNSEMDQFGTGMSIYSYNRYRSFPGLYIQEFEGSVLKKSTAILTPPEYDSLAVSDVYILSNHNVLVATSQGVFQYDPGEESIRHFSISGALKETGVSAITRWNDSLVLMSTEGDDYYLFNPKTHEFQDHFGIQYQGQVLKDQPISMYTDPEGGIWIYLQSRGTVYFHPGNQIFDHYPIYVGRHPNEVPLKTQCIVPLNQHEILATSESLGGYVLRRDGNEIAEVKSCKECPAYIKRAFKDSKGRIWINGDNDLVVMDPNGLVRRIIPVDRYSFNFQFCELPDGRILNPSQNSILISKTSAEDLPAFSVIPGLDSMYHYHQAISHPNGMVYVVASTPSPYGIYLLELDPRHGFDINRKLSLSTGVCCLVVKPENGDVLIGMRQGVFVLNIPSWSLSSFEDTGCDQNQGVQGIIALSKDQYLLCGDACITLVNSNRHTWQRFGTEHGLSTGGVNWFGYCQAPDGLVWLGDNTGVTICDPGRLQVPYQISKVNITSWEINDRWDPATVSHSSIRNPNELQVIRLRHAFNTMSFSYSAISYSGINDTEYEYRMIGMEPDWVRSGQPGFARYVNMPAGDYSFEVRVKNQPASLHAISITIVPPFYLRIWFLLASAGVFLFLMYQLVRLRVQRKQRIERMQMEKQLAIEQERVRISNNLHDDLGSGLSALNLRAQVMSERIADPSLKKEVDELAGNAGKLVEQIRETIWSTSAVYDRIDNLLTHIHQYAQEYFNNSPVLISVMLPHEEVQDPISGEARREIFLVIKEALHNVMKHSGATKVDIHITIMENKILSISILDDGNGFDVNDAFFQPGHGLTSMQMRMEAIGGKLQIESTHSGTLISISYPIR